ncbi:MAG: replication initiation protein, partial [Propionibacteriales bacterium]|nr:replication initiation protein [Propionibacteriales bacterium]
DASEGMEPGRCPGKAHRWENLGCGGRRVLVSRKWTGKTLADHQADRATVVREALAAAGIDMHDADRYSATRQDDHGAPRFVWAPIDPGREDPATYRHAILLAVEQRRRWRTEYEAAKARLGGLSATGPPGDGGEAA